MPVVAESPPLIFGGTPTPTPKPGTTPTPTPVPSGTLLPGDFLSRHDQFIDRIDRLSSCFKRSDLNDFSDREFSDHLRIAMKDKYIAQEKDMYCSMQGVNALTKTLRRLGEE